MKKRVNLKNRVSALGLSFFLALGLTAPAFNITAKAEALEVANGACTLADMIFSYCASGGVAVMNEAVIDEVYNVLGSSFGTVQTFVDNGLLTYSNGQYVDTGLSTNISSAIENISSIDIGGLFNQTAQQNPAGVALTGASSLAGIAGSVATVGTLPVVAGVAVSGFCGFQIGTIIANMLDLYNKPLGVGAEINTSENVLQKFVIGGSFGKLEFNHSYYGHSYRIFSSAGVSFAIVNGNEITLGVYNPTNEQISTSNIINAIDSGHMSVYEGFCNSKSTSTTSERNAILIHADNIFDSWSSFNSAKAQWQGGTATPNKPKSPDVIGPNGNLSGNVENGKYVFPNVNPQVNPNTQSVNPSNISEQDWKDYVNSVLQNNNTNPDNNSSIFSDILGKILINEPTVTPNPNPDPLPDPDPDPNPNPDPETVPDPVINPYPDTYPIADPETVPDNKPQPEYTEKQTENETDIVEGDPYTTPNLLDKFPFCIPRDILRAFKKLDSGSREAPHIQWRFHPNENIDHTFDIDFSVWENIASLLRLLELIAFIVALGIATRNLILS